MFVILYVGQSVFRTWLDHINVMHSSTCSGKIPPGFEDFIDGSKLIEMDVYTKEQSRLGIFEGIASDLVLLIILISGFLPMLVSWSGRLGFSLVPAGLFFFFMPGIIEFLVELPFSYYNTFRIEQKFGFNRSTLKLWIIDLIKSGLVSIVIFAALFSILLLTVEASPRFWWFWGFLIVASVQFLIAVLYPIVIAPLFNKFEPVRDELIAGKIKTLMENNGIRVKKILQMNAGLRSRHTNAYFTGIGKTKQIVLYDTLLESHTHDEILAVLAHEAGHFRKKHIMKQLGIFAIFSLAAFYATYLLIGWPLLYSTFGFATPLPYVGFFLASIFWQKSIFFLQPVYMEVSRRFEREADIFAVNILRTARPMVTALKRLAADNLSNLNPHPLYVWFHYSHPSLVERVALLEHEGRRFEPAGTADMERLGN